MGWSLIAGLILGFTVLPFQGHTSEGVREDDYKSLPHYSFGTSLLNHGYIEGYIFLMSGIAFL